MFEFRHLVTDLVNRTGEEFFLSKAQWRIRLMESLNRNLEGGGTWLVMVELDIRSEFVTIMVFVLGHRIKQLICWRWFIPTPKIFNLVRLKFPISRCIKQNDLVRVQIFCIHKNLVDPVVVLNFGMHNLRTQPHFQLPITVSTQASVKIFIYVNQQK